MEVTVTIQKRNKDNEEKKIVWEEEVMMEAEKQNRRTSFLIQLVVPGRRGAENV